MWWIEGKGLITNTVYVVLGVNLGEVAAPPCPAVEQERLEIDTAALPSIQTDTDQEQETEGRVGSKLKIITGEMDIKQRQENSEFSLFSTVMIAADYVCSCSDLYFLN